MIGKTKIFQKELIIKNDSDGADKFIKYHEKIFLKWNGNHYFKINDLCKSGKECEEGIINKLAKMNFMACDDVLKQWKWFNYSWKGKKDIRQYVRSSNDYVDEKLKIIVRQ